MERIFKHLNVNADGRTYKFQMKNLENKIRRLPEYKARYNKVFDSKRLKKYKDYKRKPDELFEMRKDRVQELEDLPEFDSLTDTRKWVLRLKVEELLDKFDKEDGQSRKVDTESTNWNKCGLKDFMNFQQYDYLMKVWIE